MKKIYASITTFIVLLSFLSTNVNAQIFSTVGSGVTYNTSFFSYPAPYGNYYGGARHMLFVTAAELTTAGIAGGAQISSIGFNIFSLNGGVPHQGWNMKVYTTTLTDPLATNWISATPVASSTPITATGIVGWNQTTFTSPFIWNGSDNLVIETCFNNMSYVQNYSTYWETTLTGSAIKSRWNYQDNTAAVCSNPSSATSTTTRPNMRFEWISPTPCTAAPSANSVVTPTVAICPNSSAFIGLASSYTIGGLTYQWQSSTVSAVGPFVNVAGATSPNMTTPNLTVNTFYQAVITCTNTSSGSTNASAGQVSVSPVILNDVPYYESFEGIGVANKLPNCSWSASNLPTNCQTYVSSNTLGRMPRTGTSFASFFYTPAGVRYFYTNGINLIAGITYSASLWYQTEYIGYNNWTDLSILYGTTQTPTGLISIASSNGPAISNIYKSLSNTFTVATSGVYYVAVRATAASGSAQYLTWDDLSITIPCTSNSLNTPTINLAANTTTICAGNPVNLTVAGADTYTWSNGSNSTVLNETPAMTTTYNVVGTNTLTGCMTSANQVVEVKDLPNVFVLSNLLSVCAGSPANLTALGNAVSFAWSNGSTGANITVNPSASTTYSVLATGANGCTGVASQLINVNQLPTVSATTSRPNEMCPTETAILTAAGSAVSYQWISNTSPALLTGNPINVSPSATSVYTVTGTDANGCQNKSTVVQNVLNCTGITEQTVLSSLSAYPNPTSGEFAIESGNTLNKAIEVIDVTGKVVLTSTSNVETVKINIKNLSSGVYYVKIQSNSTVEIIKVVKQ